MTAEYSLLDQIPTRDILQGLARIHQLVLVTDQSGRIVWMSDGLGLLLGGGERFIGHACQELIPRLPHPEHVAAIEEELASKGEVHDFSLELRPRAGVEKRVDVSVFRVVPAVPDATPADTLMVAIVRPLENRQRMETELRDSVHFLSSMLDVSPDAVIATDRDGFISYANPAVEQLLGVAPADLVRKPAAFFVPATKTWSRVATTIQEQSLVTSEELELRRADGSLIWVSMSARPLKHANGGAAGNVAFLRDITERRRMQTRLERKNTELESYVHSVSHDLRSPLVSLLGFTRLLRQDYEAVFDDTGNHFVDRIEQAGRTMEALISDLLELSAIAENDGPRTPVDPRGVLLQIHAEIKPRLDERGIRLSLPEDPPMLACDRTRLYQIFSNLLGNALAHMGPVEAPHIQVEVWEEPEHHRIAVRDNGKGIPQKAQGRVFELFRTLGPRTDERRATGIGLAIVKKIAEIHDGRVWVESEPGEGAHFHIALPRPR